MKRGHIVLSRLNNSKGRKDATGAFTPASNAFKRLMLQQGDAVLHTQVRVRKNTYKSVQHIVDTALDDFVHGGVRPYSLSLFCHGWRQGVELWERKEKGAHGLAHILAHDEVPFLNLFACSAADVHHEGSFAEWVAEKCADLGHEIQVFGHETPGHTTWNPKIVVWWSTGGTVTHQEFDEDLIIDWTPFREKMREDQTYRLALPFSIADQ